LAGLILDTGCLRETIQDSRYKIQNAGLFDFGLYGAERIRAESSKLKAERVNAESSKLKDSQDNK